VTSFVRRIEEWNGSRRGGNQKIRQFKIGLSNVTMLAFIVETWVVIVEVEELDHILKQLRLN
jgi:hypothetical protein